MAGTGLLSPGSVSPFKFSMGNKGKGKGILLATIEEGEDEEIEEGAKPKSILLPTMPSQSQIEEHRMTHCPYRAWCEECVMGAGVSTGHRGVGDMGETPLV